MKYKLVVPRQLAGRDVDAAIEYYLAEGAEKSALGFIEALENAYGYIRGHPASGSPRYGHELDLPGLRRWPLKRYTHLVFYMDRADHIDVWRVLRGSQYIPSRVGETV